MLRLRSLRERRGFSQKEFAAEMDLPTATYNQYETGKRTPDIEMLIRFADYFTVTVDYLIGHDTPSAPPPPPPFQISRYEQILIEEYREHPEMWAGIQAMLKLFEPLSDEENARTITAMVEALHPNELKKSVLTK